MNLHDIERPGHLSQEPAMAWTSDVAAEMLRRLGIDYIALNPGASYRGLHDSLVNYNGNRAPQMLLCLNEDHVVSIAHGYAKASDKMMACVLHSNVGLMHGLMGIFNAWCDRMPILVLGANGPVDNEMRRPWIDWIHTTKDQGALLRNFVKWDDEPRSVGGIIESFLRAAQITMTAPRAPVYVCLDAGLQEEKLGAPVTIPDVSRFTPPPPPAASQQQVDEALALIQSSRSPLILLGRASRDEAAWERRVRFAELLGAPVLTSIRERSVFPTEHRLHAAPPMQWLPAHAKPLMAQADLILSLDWPDLDGTLLQAVDETSAFQGKIVSVSLDRLLHNGWSMDHFSLPPVDLPVLSDADTFVAQLLPALEAGPGRASRDEEKSYNVPARAEYSANSASEIQPRDVEVALSRARHGHQITLAHVTLGWAGDVYAFRGPLDFLGHDGGGGLAAGPGLTIGAALALRDSGRIVVSVLGDGDTMQGISAFWTAAHYGIPALFIVSNNGSHFNDEIHQEAMAKARNRPVENRWIGQRIADPELDIPAMAAAQGVQAGRQVKNVPELEAELAKGLQIVSSGKPYLIDARVVTGYANPPLSRGRPKATQQPGIARNA